MNLGFAPGQVVQEFYFDDDSDGPLRSVIEQETGESLVDEDYGDVVDGAIVWWRSDDAEEEDLADLLVDAMSNLDDGGLIWVFIPKPDRPGVGRQEVVPIELADDGAGLMMANDGVAFAGARMMADSQSKVSFDPADVSVEVTVKARFNAR